VQISTRKKAENLDERPELLCVISYF